MSSASERLTRSRPSASAAVGRSTTHPTRSLRAVLSSIGDLIPAALAGFSLVASTALVTGQFHPAIVLGIGLPVGLAVAVLLGPERRAVQGRTDLPALGVAALIAAGSAYVSMRLSGEFLFAWRDPGAYLIAGRWLYDHPALLMPTDYAVFGDVAGLDATSLGFGVVDGQVQAQGYHGLPTLLAAGSWIARHPHFGNDVNPVLGGCALLAVYALARRVAGPWWALLPVAALAASMPFVAFTRDTYSEPLALLFAAGSMSLLWRAVESRRIADFAVAGLVAGAGGLGRVDAYVTLLGFLAALALFLMVSPRAGAARALACLAAATIAAAVPVTVGLLDVMNLSTLYWAGRVGDSTMLAQLAGVILIGGLLLAVVGWRTPVGRWLGRRRRHLGWVAAGLTLAGSVVLASRPLWWVSHQNDPPGFESLRLFQTSLGEPVDVTRSYEELSVNWIAWYHGWPAVALGAVGLALVVRRCVADERTGAHYFLLATLGTGLLYLNQSSIFPDQVWAMRRYLPVVIPGVLVGAAAVLAWSWERRGRWRLPMRSAALVGGAIVVLWTTTVTLPMVRVPSYRPQLAEVETVCHALPADAALLLVDDAGQARGGYQAAFRAFCEIPVSGLENPPAATLADVAAAATAAGRRLYVASMAPDDVPWRSEPRTPWLTSDVVKWPERLLEPPSGPSRFVRTLYLGTVGADGQVDAAPAPPDPTLDPDDSPPPSD